MSTYWYAVCDERKQVAFIVGQHDRPSAELVGRELLRENLFWPSWRLVTDEEYERLIDDEGYDDVPTEQGTMR